MTAHERAQRPGTAPARAASGAARAERIAPVPPMSTLLASCAAAAAVSQPPDEREHTPAEPVELNLPAEQPDRGAA
ncbi:hypothetical protein [Streptomyces cacaoi]|uniref:hypothetical protein n=1 Tax=Streptomyces cacaoi TaxID=1898 RepID=UPI003749EA22